MLHEIWMLFISPANPAFCGQTPSTGKDYYWPKRRKTTEINLAVVFVEHTNTQTDDMHVNTRVHSFFSQGSQQTHYYHTQTKSHTPRCGKTTHTSAGQCLPEDQRELWMLTSRATLHVCGSPQNTSHCCPSFWLPSMTPLPQTSQHPHIATSPQPDGFFFFFLTVCGLLHLCSTTLNPWDGWVEWKVWSSAWTNGLEVAEQIKRIKRSLFTDTSKLFWRWAMDPPTHTHLLQHPNNSPPRQKSDTHKDISTASRSCACAYITHHQYTV